jgi:hypothetical protein
MNISNEELQEGYRISHMITVCKYDRALFCLFGKKDNIPSDCWQECGLAEFRIAFESNSPAFWGEFLKLSDANKKIHNYLGGEIEGLSYQELKEASIEFEELKTYLRAALMALYPLFLANELEFPFLTPEEVQEEIRFFSREKIDLIAKEMKNLNKTGWLDQVCYRLGDLSRVKGYANVVFLMIGLFLKGLRKEENRLFQCIEISCQKEGSIL